MKNVYSIIVKRFVATFVWLVFFLPMTFAAYLTNVPQTLVQPNGDTVHCFATGDEFYHRLHDADGYTIILDRSTGYYVYANKIGDQLVPTAFIAGRVNPAEVGLTPNLSISAEQWRARRQQWNLSTPAPARTRTTRSGEQNHGHINNLVVFIRFADDEPFVNEFSDVEAMFNSTTRGYNSMYNYFKSATYDQLTITSTFYPPQSGTTILSYQDTYNRRYFEPYSTANPDGYDVDDNYDRTNREHQLLKRATEYIAGMVPADLDIDYDGDGYVDNVCFVVRGNVGEWNDLLWPHRWSLSTDEAYINGKRVWTFNFQLADAVSYFRNSVLCHEMNHSLSAPDLYHYYVDKDMQTVGPWDLMENNQDPLQHMGAYMKYKYGKWISEIPEITECGTYSLHSLGSSSTNNCYAIASPHENEFFVLEYRNTNDAFEGSLPGSGLLVYRINTEFEGNASYDGEMVFDEVYLYRPNGTTTNNGNINQAAFSANTGRTEMNANTNPYPFLTDGTVVPVGEFTLRDISEAGGDVITFTVCRSESAFEAPTVTTDTIRDVTTTTATLQGTVTDDGGAEVTERGFCYSYSEYSPTIADDHITSGTTGTGVFTASLTELTPYTTYYVRAYATNSEGTRYGEMMYFITPSLDDNHGQPCTGTPTITDRDGNTYNTVQIGNQCWMKENLRTTKFNDGTSISQAQDFDTWNSYADEASAAYCSYDINTYGCLYNYYAVAEGKLCPSGWHVPSYNEVWSLLANSMQNELGDRFDMGGKMKIAGTDYWTSPNIGATDYSGFSAKGGGVRVYNGFIQNIQEYAMFWTSTPYEDIPYSYDFLLWNNGAGLYSYGYSNYNYALYWGYGLSVRCLRNELAAVTTYPPYDIAATTATCDGYVIADNGTEVTGRGVCWSTSPDPTIANSHTTDGAGTGGFTSSLTGLAPATTYYVRAYATNGMGTAYGDTRSFITMESANVSGTVTDATTSRPIAGAYVSIFKVDDNNSNFVTTVTTDANGRFSVQDMVRTTYRFAANAAGYESTQTEQELSSANNVVNLALTPEACEAPVNVDYEQVGRGLNLSWEMPGDTMTQLQSMESEGISYGLGSQYSVGVYHLFTPEQLVAYNGGIINSVGAYITGSFEYTTYTLRIWVGGTEYDGPASGSPAYEQVVSQEGITMNAWNDIPLNTPFAFDGTQCLWIGFHVDCNDPAGNTIYAIAVGDYGNVNNHYGNVLHWYQEENGWYWRANSGLSYNWMIRATLVPNSMTYNIYQDGEEIASNVAGTSYTVSPYVPQQEETCFQVSANCPNGQTSERSECATVQQALPTVVTLEVSGVTDSKAMVRGAVTSDGNSELIRYGFVYSTTAHPNFSRPGNYYNFEGNIEGEYSRQIENLAPQTTYYIRAYATNSLGTAYGNELSFTTREECVQPENLTVSDVLSSSAWVMWQGGDNDAFLRYELSYKAEGSEEWTVVTTTDEYYMLTGLQQQTTYTVRVRALCDEEVGSDYAESTFTTGCMSGAPDVIIGETTGSNYGYVLPSNLYYNYSYTQQIYKAEEIGSARTIRVLYLQYFWDRDLTRKLDIYMGHTSKGSFSDGNDWVPVTEMTKVQENYSIVFTANQDENYWIAIPLSVPFEYNGSDNLVIAFDDNTGNYNNASGSDKFYTHSSNNAAIYLYRDSESYDPANPDYGNLISYRNNLRIQGVCNEDGCERANVVVRAVTDGSATLMIAPAGSNSYELQYAVAGSDDYTTLVDATGTEYRLDGLRQNTRYEVRIRSICGPDEYSDWKTVTFTTAVKSMQRIYVSTTGTGDGSSWATAANDLAWALNTAYRIQETYFFSPEVWVAEGTYVGDSISRDAFTVRWGLKMYGGFAGGETSLAQRDVEAHPTILDGQNNQRVLRQQAYTSDTLVIDGFILQNGWAHNGENNGGGARMTGNFKVRNCLFRNNRSEDRGGAVYVNDNYYAEMDSDYGFYNCEFTGNRAHETGGAVCDDSQYAIYVGCKFIGNVSENYAGGVRGGRSFINCAIINNFANQGSGGIQNVRDLLLNCDIAGNTANYGSGIGLREFNGTMINCAIWGNHVIDGNSGDNNVADCYFTSVQNCAVEGGLQGYGDVMNLASDNSGSNSSLNYPYFVSPQTGDYRLRDLSALIDAGNTEVSELPATDLSGLARVYGNAVDIGCYENHEEHYCTAPYQLAVQSANGSSAILSWENGDIDAPAYYELSYKLAEADEWTVVAEHLTTNYYALGGLQQQSDYEVRVRAFCDAQMSSDYSDVLAFSTGCADYTDPVVIGESWTYTTNSYPFYAYYPYSYSQQIYDAEEIGTARVIDTLYLQYYSSYTATRTVDIYLGHTDKSYFATNTDWVSNDALTLVYSGTLTFNNEGENYWFAIPLTNSFEYNGTDNLVMAFNDMTGNTTNSGFYMNGTNYYKVMYKYSSSAIDLDNIGSTYYREYYHNNLKLPGNCLSDVCPRANLVVRDVTESSATLVFSTGADANGLELEYKKAGEDTYIPLSTEGSSLQLTDLMHNTDYEARIRSLCVEDSSSWTTVNFTTLAKPLEHLYVTTTGTGDGSSWTEAAGDLNWAVNTALRIRQEYGIEAPVWVAQGIYYGDGVSNDAFKMAEGVNVYGGFAGDEPADYNLSQRDFENHTTILDGQNSQRVLYQPSGFNVRTTWDGFTLQNGYALDNSGGGAYLKGGVILNHCTVTHNQSNNVGAGVYCDNGSSDSTYLWNCSFTHNTTPNGYGGGAYLSWTAVDSCLFANNQANSGGGAYIYNSQIYNSTFTQNKASYEGGVYLNTNSKMDHCVVTYNTAGYGGGVYLYNYTSTSTSEGIYNCLIAHNTATYQGGGVDVSYWSQILNSTIVNNQTDNNGSSYVAGVYYSSNSSYNRMLNSVVWGNTRNGEPSNINGDNVSMQKCAIEGLEDNVNVINLSANNFGTEEGQNYPFFVTPENDDYRLRDGSALINAGMEISGMSAYDLAGASRVYGDTVDIGCYEFHGEEYCVAPFALVAEEVTGSSAMLTWRNSNENAPDHYELSYMAEDADEWTVVDNLHTDYYMLSGLEPQSTYRVRLRTFCDGETSSDYSPTLSFSTNCPGDYAPEVIIGTDMTTGSNTNTVPIYAAYRHSYTQQIYLADEIGAERTIDTIYLQYFNSSMTTRKFNIYLAHTEKDRFNEGYDAWVTSGLEKVFSGSFTFDNSGDDNWIAIPLQTPFAYNGTDNLLVAFKDSTGSTSSSHLFYNTCTNSASRAIYYGSYSEMDIDIVDIDQFYYWANSTCYRANIKFPTVCSDGCDRANIAIREVTDASALLYFAAGSGTEGYEMSYRPSGTEEYITLTATESPYLLTGLTQNTSYDVRIRSLCSGDETSRWVSRTFRTLPKNLDHLYVSTTGTGDASSWEEASSDLLWTMNTAARIREEYGTTPVVWVAQGTYFGDSVSPNAFTMVEGVNVYGGFVGNEPVDYDLSQRDVVNHASILDGQHNQRVLYQPENFNNLTIWDGFTIQNGKTQNNNLNQGGGAYLRQMSALYNCHITHNESQTGGGGVYVYASYGKPAIIDHCTIDNNTAYNNGGGLAVQYAVIRYCTITHNYAQSSYGGGVYVYYGNSNACYVLSNCLIANNTSDYRGGGIYSTGYATTTIDHCTVVNNESVYNDGGGIYCESSNNYIYNSILWGNRATGGGADNLKGAYISQYNAVENFAVVGTGNIALITDNEEALPYCPRFVRPSGSAGYTAATENADWHLQQGSICANRGENTLMYVADSMDLDGTARIKMDTVDLGCYESEYGSIVLPEYGGIVYVKENGSGAMDGTSWDNALSSLANALVVASMHDADVWVAAGTYYGDSVSISAFNMVQGVDVYGGFVGNEAEDYDLSLRNFEVNVSILDGQHNQRLIYQSENYTVPTVWDGFTIQNGNARYDSQNGYGQGGGVFLRAGVTMKNCVITGNTSNSDGGGVYAEGYNYEDYDTIRLVNCTLSHNTSGYNAGGAFLSSKAVLDNSVVENNACSNNGGGLYTNNRVVVRNSKIRHNRADSYGGGVYGYSNTWCEQCDISYNQSDYQGGGVYGYNSVSLSNCLIANNTSLYGSGGGLYSSYSNIKITNTTIVNNEVSDDDRGAGIYVGSSNTSSLTITNSVVWGNKRGGMTDGIYGYYTGNYAASYVASDDICRGEHNIMLSEENEGESVFAPRFVHPAVGVGVYDTTSNVDWHLKEGSSCINHGENSVATQYDLDGANRVQQDTVDLGCYESPYNGIALPEYGDIIYVVEGGAGTRTGESWENAIGSVQEAVGIAAFNNAKVWVAAGTYHGDGTSENAFVMKPGVDVYGGFAGNEAPDYDLSQRDFAANASVLDGQYTQRVLMQDVSFDANTAVVWDGFTIQNGRVTGNGAGVYMSAYSTLRNCVVQNNIIASEDYTYGSYYGAGVYVKGNSSTPHTFVSYCTISYNGYDRISTLYGGGVYVYYAKVDHTEISHNTATYGGGIEANYYANLSNCLIFDNTATYGGGVYVHNSNTRFVNCDVVKNTATSYGGGFYHYYNPTVINSIVWGNKLNLAVDNVSNYSNYTYCAIEPDHEGSTVSGEDNITLASTNDGFDNTKFYVRFTDPENGDFQLHPSSSCINVGNSNVVTDTLDLYRNQRIIGEQVDMGCSEVQDENSCRSVINLTANNITTNSALLSWHARGEESQWLVVYGEVGSDDILSATVSDTTYQITGLSLNREYAAKVRALCDENAMSIFSIPVYFQTTCDPAQLDTLPNFGSMFPANNEIVYNSRANFSWAALDHATSYDFYLWNAMGSEPATPSLSGLTQPVVSNYALPGYGPGAVFYWKVVAWNECISKSSEVMTINANKLPDLHVTGINCSNPRIGQTVTVEWTVKNDGEGNTPPGVNWREYIWLVHDADVRWYDEHDRRLADIGNLQALNAGESYTTSANVTIPTDIDPGNYYLFVFADQPDAYSPDFSQCPGGVAPNPYTPSVTGDPYPYVTGNVHFEGVVDETEDHDNFFYVVLTVLPPPSPDLAVSAVTHTAEALSGHEANVTWTVVNQGEAAAMGSWADAVYLSSDTILDVNDDLRIGRFIHEGPLAINESYQHSEQFTVPVDYDGVYYFIIMTDNSNNVYEGLQEMNNKTVSTGMPVTMSWYTDLQVSDVTIPAQVDANGLYNCSFTVTNNGLSPTNVSRWTDAIYLSQDAVLDRNNARRVAAVVHTSALTAYDMDNPENSSYQVEAQVRIPANITGSWYLYVMTDAEEEVFEYNAEDNNVVSHQPALTVQTPDLTVTTVILPDVVDPNEPVRVQWTVRNDGPGNVVSRSFKDKFFYNGTLIYTANVRDVNISVGDSIVRFATVQFSCLESGIADLLISTDEDDEVLESVETNNRKTVRMEFSTPDLVVSEVTPLSNDNEAALWSGAAAELSYTLTNNGLAAAVNANSADKIYFSTSPDTYQASDLIYTNTHALNIGAGESVTFSCTVTLPNGISGPYYYHVVCNANGAVCEGTHADNNGSASDAVEVQLSPSPDLTFTQVVAPDEAYLGASFELTYTIRNQGTAEINSSVMQKFYYSMSPTAYDTTKLLATVYDYLTLEVNEEVTNVANVTLPAGMPYGNYYIHAVTDANNQIYEHNGEDNNKGVSNRVVAATYQLDLQLTQIDAPDEMQWGQTATCTLHVRNISSLPTLASSWQDIVYLSSDNVLHSTDRVMQAVRHTTTVEAGEEYEVEVQVTIPYGTPATAYLIGVTDYERSNPDINISNNLLTTQLSVSSVPTPDMAVSDLVILDDVYAGQPARIAYKVTNVGDAPIENETWNDKLFISYNNTYENIDLQLLNKDRQRMTLDQEEFYRDTLTFTVPMSYNGSLYLLMMANASNNPYEANQTNNTAAVPVNVVLPLPGDLVVTSVTCESRVVSGQMLHAGWTIQNIGDNTLVGQGLRSLVYISADTVFDANDRLLGSVTTPYITLGIDETMQQSLSGRVSGLAAGNYYLIVKTDVTNAFNEVSDENNTGCSVDPFAVMIRPLPFNQDVPDTLINDVVSDYMLTVGSQVNQTVRIHVNSEDSILGAVNMIYATYNNMGNNLNYSYSTIGQYTANSELYIPATQPGYYGVNFYGSTPTNQPQNVILRADILPFELIAVNDNHGGNTGVVTVELTGSRFRPDMEVCLRYGNEVICADTLIYVNYYQAFAQFDLTGRTPGVYDVSAVNFCEGEAVLAEAFTIENGQPSGLAYNLLFPSSPRPNRTVVMMLEFGNTGNIDLHDQVLEITSVGGAPISLTSEGLSEHRTTIRVPLTIEGEPNGLLRPGSYGTLNIYCYSSGALIFTIKPVEE